MICTEQEAASKWCPHVRMLAPSHVETAGAASYNRSPFENDPPHGVGCIGSACMMWVWVGAPIVPDYSKEIGKIKLNPDRSGTCGLIRSQS